jgi:Tol biopolymer transport system component
VTDPDRWRRVELIYDDAISREGADRARFLDGACGGDEALRRDIESLLDADREVGDFLETPAADILERERRASALTGRQLGPYRIESLIGSGGMGEVYAAQDTRLDRRVAVKVLPPHFADRPESRQRFEREAKAIGALSHPHICALYDVGTDEGTSFLVMELLEGETLDQRLLRGPLPLAEAVQDAIEIAEALDEAHRRGIVHRDLKPANVMLTRAGAKLLDFGVAKWETEEHDLGVDGLTREGTILGTLPYMAPEQLEGKRPDARTDLFAFGAILYEMVTGRRAFTGGSRASVIAAVLTADAPPLTGLEPPVPPALQRLITTCLAKDPGARVQTARQAIDDLKAIATGTTMAARESQEESRPHQWRRARVAWVAGGVSVGIVTLFAVIFGVGPFRRSINREPPPVYFVVGPPENATFSVRSQSFLAVSPDGRFLAFTASASQGRLALWVRAFDTLIARQLPGDEASAGQPFWSPDGRYIAYTAPGGKLGFVLKKIDVSGGMPQPLAEVSILETGTWSANGVILFRPNDDESKDGGLYSVSAAGGPLTHVTTLDASRGELAHKWPQFLPDGRHFLYLVVSSQPQNDGIVYIGSLDTPERIRLFASDSNVDYADGHLLFMRGNTLLAQPFDADTLRVSGDAAAIAEQVERNPGSRRGAFSVSTTGRAVLAYRSLSENQLVWYDRNGKRLDAIGPKGYYSNPALSPDEQTLAVMRRDVATSASDIYVIDVARGTASRITFEGSPVDSPLWSPDGTQILFTSHRYGVDSPDRWSIRQKAATGAGTEETLLTELLPGTVLLGWSRDGRVLEYGTGTGKNAHLELLPRFGDRTSVPFPKTPFAESQGSPSPDGQWMAYTSDETGRNEVYVRRFPSGESKVRVSIDGGAEPTWRKDGRELFFLGVDRALMAVPIAIGPALTPGPPVRLFDTSMSNLRYQVRNQYCVASNGQRFLVTQPVAAASPTITVVLNWPAILTR